LSIQAENERLEKKIFDGWQRGGGDAPGALDPCRARGTTGDRTSVRAVMGASAIVLAGI
jgi:hypothetical protein